MNGEKKDIKSKAFKGTLWKFTERLMSQVVSLIVSIVLARLLLPEDYGVVSIVTMFFALCNVLIDSGLNSALIQKKNADELDFSTVLACCMAMSVLLYAIVFAFAPLIARLYDLPVLLPLMRIMGLILFINSYFSVLSAYVSSTLQFKLFFYSNLSGVLFSALIGITLAYQGYGPWALTAQQLSYTFITTLVLNLVIKFRPSFKFSYERFRGLFDYGWKILISSIISVIYSKIKPLIVGYKYSTRDLAYYDNGQKYPDVLNSSITTTLSSVLFPVISKFQDDMNSVLSISRRYMKLSSFVVVPLLLGVYGVSENFVLVFLTDRWLPIVPYMRIFCIAYLLEFVQMGNLQAIRAIGRSDMVLKLEIIKKIFYFIVIILFIIFINSPKALAFTEVICNIAACCINAYPNRKLIKYGYRQQLKDVLPNFVLGIVMLLIILVVGCIQIESKYFLLILQIILGIITYIIFALVTKNENLLYIYGILKCKQNAKDNV